VADTSYLRRVVENFVRDGLAVEFGRPFTARFLPLLPGGQHDFDAVSDDGAVVASVKSASGLTAGGRTPNGKIKDSIAELYYLSPGDAPIRRLVLTTPDFFTIFMRKTKGAVAEGIQIVCVPLPIGIQAKVNKVVELASREVTLGAAASAVAAEVETALDSRHAARR
jgi:hypothetical protein